MNIITKPYRRTGLLEKLQNILVDIEDQDLLAWGTLPPRWGQNSDLWGAGIV